MAMTPPKAATGSHSQAAVKASASVGRTAAPAAFGVGTGGCVVGDRDLVGEALLAEGFERVGYTYPRLIQKLLNLGLRYEAPWMG